LIEISFSVFLFSLDSKKNRAVCQEMFSQDSKKNEIKGGNRTLATPFFIS